MTSPGSAIRGPRGLNRRRYAQFIAVKQQHFPFPTPHFRQRSVFRCCRRDSSASRLPRSSSIDSVVDAAWASPVASHRVPSPLLGVRHDSRAPPLLASPSVGRRLKGARAVTGKTPLSLHVSLSLLVSLAPATGHDTSREYSLHSAFYFSLCCLQR